MSRTTISLCSAFALATAFTGAVLAVEPRPVQEAGQHYYRAKQVIGAKVSLAPNAAIGVVDDIVLDDNGNVDYLIVLNSDKKLVTVPWDAINFNVDRQLATINIAPEKFREVPTYTVEKYPVFSTPAYRTQVYRSYGLTPGQERRTVRRAVGLPR